jgi:PAS domain S-box-containing protein
MSIETRPSSTDAQVDPGGWPAGRPAPLAGNQFAAGTKVESDDLIASQLAEIEMLYRTAPVGLCFFDRDLRFVRVNEHLAEMNGVPATEHIGRSIREVVPDLAETAEPLMRKVLETREPVVGLELVGETAAQPGVQRTWIETWTPVVDRDGQILGINVIAEEVTQRRRHEQLREAFLDVLSHELRAPITAIYGAATLLSRNGTSSDPPSLLHDILEEADRANQLIEDLSILSRAENGGLTVPTEPLMLSHEVADVAGRVGRRFPKLTIALDTPAGLPPVAADRTSVRQIVTNLLVNAAKYAGGHVTVRIEPAGAFLAVVVADSGPGFDAHEASRLFDLFYRGRRTVKVASGTGTGLFVAKTLVEAMGGMIEAQPRQPRGAEFRFTLPITE